MNKKIAKFIAFRLPPAVLLWAVVRAFAITSMHYGKKPVTHIKYKHIYSALTRIYKLER